MRLFPDDYADDEDADIDRGGTIVGPIIPPRRPAKPPYHVRYPPAIDEPVIFLIDTDGDFVPESVDNFDADETVLIDLGADMPDRFALGSRSKGRTP